MMVNQLNNNNITPWQNTIPSQMPWLDPYAARDPLMQFGQVPYAQGDLVHPPVGAPSAISAAANLNPSQPALSPTAVASIPSASNCHQLSNPIPGPAPHCSMLDNPFASQLTAGHQKPVPNLLYPHQPPKAQDSQFAGSSLTQLPQYQPAVPAPCPEVSARPLHQKRSSVEMEDDLTTREAPPTKQQLSENKLFRRFGTLQLDGEMLGGLAEEEDEQTDSDSSDDSVVKGGCVQDRKDFNRYVYLLFKDKKSNNLFKDGTSGAMDRLIRDEREKLSKAVILWSPPLKDSLVGGLYQDDDEDEEFKYTDHRDFLKAGRRVGDDEDSIIITEVEDDVPIVEESQLEPDDLMQD